MACKGTTFFDICKFFQKERGKMGVFFQKERGIMGVFFQKGRGITRTQDMG
jgi:hypothetical protein